jgi:hypothetical protein
MRLTAWQARGCQPLEDVAEYHRALGVTSLFGKRPKLQRTWTGLIRIALSAEGEPGNTDAVRQYQGERLGRPGGNTCLLELLPLPAPSVGHWHYHEWSTLPYLTDRDSYRQHFAPRRAASLRCKIERHQPRAVIFYSTDARYRQWWRTIAGVEMPVQKVEGISTYVGSNSHTLFINTPHPVARGLTNRYFHAVGQLIA